MYCYDLDQSPTPQGSDVAVDTLSPGLTHFQESERDYLVRRLGWQDFARQDEYQRMRTATFVDQLGWNIPVDHQGRERDRYDCMDSSSIDVYGVYGQRGPEEHLLGGIRIFSLQQWSESMVVNEFFEVGMLPANVLEDLETTYDCRDILEITRLCVRRGRWYDPQSTISGAPFNCAIVRDLTYAAAYNLAEQTGRGQALGITDSGYLKVMNRSHFVFQELYTGPGFKLVMIDLWGTVRSIYSAGDEARAERMLALCSPLKQQAIHNMDKIADFI